MIVSNGKFILSREEYDNVTKDYGTHPCSKCTDSSPYCVGFCKEILAYNRQFEILPADIRYLAKYHNKMYALDNQIEELEKHIEKLKKNRADIIKDVNSQIIIDEDNKD